MKLIINQLKPVPKVKRKIYCSEDISANIKDRVISSDIQVFVTDFRSKDIIHITDDICMIDEYLFY